MMRELKKRGKSLSLFHDFCSVAVLLLSTDTDVMRRLISISTVSIPSKVLIALSFFLLFYSSFSILLSFSSPLDDRRSHSIPPPFPLLESPFFSSSGFPFFPATVSYPLVLPLKGFTLHSDVVPLFHSIGSLLLILTFCNWF